MEGKDIALYVLSAIIFGVCIWMVYVHDRLHQQFLRDIEERAKRERERTSDSVAK
jgi:hypothetical protein